MQNNTDTKFISRPQMQAILDNRPKGVDGKSLIDRFVNDGFKVEGVNDQTVEKPSALSTLGTKLSDRLGKIKQAGSEIASTMPNKDTTFGDSTQNGLDNAKNTAKIIGNTVGGIADIINTGIGAVADATGVTKGIENIIGNLSESQKQTLAGAIKTGGDTIKTLFPDDTIRGEVAKALGNIVDVAGSVTGIKAAGETGFKTTAKLLENASAGAVKTVDAVGNVIKPVTDLITPAVEKVKSVGNNVKVNLNAMKEKEALIKALPSKTQQTMARKGIDIADINTLTGISKEALPEVQQLLKAAKDFSNGVSKLDPQDIVGKPLTAKITQLEKLREQVGQKLGTLSENLGILDNQTVQDAVLKRMQGIGGLKGLKIAEDGTLDFGETVLKSSLSDSSKKTIEIAFKEAVDSGSGKQAHLFRQELFDILDGKKRSLTQLNDTEDKALNAIRAGLSDVLEVNNPAYKTASNEYRKIVQPLSDLRKLSKNLDPNNTVDILDTAGGILARRLTSNASSRTQVQKVLQALDDATAVKGKVSQKTKDLIDAYSLVGKYYDIAQATSFKGLQEQAFVKSAQGVADATMKAAGKLTGDTPEVRQKLIEDLISELLKAKK